MEYWGNASSVGESEHRLDGQLIETYVHQLSVWKGDAQTLCFQFWESN